MEFCLYRKDIKVITMATEHKTQADNKLKFTQAAQDKILNWHHRNVASVYTIQTY